MRSTRFISALSSVIALVSSLTVASAAAGQAPAPAPSCAMVTVEEANAIFGGADLALNDNSAGYYCAFGGAFDLTLSVMTDTDLEEAKVRFGGGGEDVPVGDRPGWWQESSGNFAVAANGSVVLMNGWDSADTSDGQRALLTALAELVAPRIPPASDPAVVARLTALLPPAIRDTPDASSVVPGWYVVPPGDASSPERASLGALLAAQGRTTADLVLVFGQGTGGDFAIVGEVPGLDASALLLPLLHAIVPTASAAPVSMVEIGGRPVARVETDPPMVAFVSGDAAVYASGSDAFVASLLTPTP